MSLSGHVSELALGDLLQVTAMHRRTCCIEIDDPLALGEIYFESGEVTHAQFGELSGNEAVYALLATESARFELRTGVRTKARTVSASFQELLLESARLHDEGRLIEPTTRRRRSSLAPFFAATRPARWREGGRGRRPALLLLLLVSGLWLFGGLLWLVTSSGDAEQAATSAHAEALQMALLPATESSSVGGDKTGVQGADLVQPGDEAPVLITGGIAEAPAAGGALLPTIVCRVLVGADGRVRRIQVARPRPELAAFESIAVDTVKGFRFSPARRAGTVIEAWVNVPVPFRSRAVAAQRRIRIKGSDTIGGELGPALGKAYSEQEGGKVEIEALGSSTAFVGLLDGSADIGAASRSISPQELQRAAELGLELQEFAIGYDGIAVIVHPDNPIRSLSMQQLGAVFRGETRDWAELPSGRSGPIQIFSRPSYSGTHGFFKERVLSVGAEPGATLEFTAGTRFLEKNSEVVAAVMASPAAIAYVGLGWSDGSVRSLAVSDGSKPAVAPAVESVRDGSYPIYRPLLMYTRGQPRGEVAAFLRFVFSPRGQALVERAGFVGSDAPFAGFENAGLPIGDEADIPEVVRVYFDSGSAHMNSEARRELQRAVDMLRAGSHHAVVVGGADAQGDTVDNAALSNHRAERVWKHLLSQGVSPELVRVEPGGESRPLATNGSDEGRRVNRRVDVYLAAR